MSLRQAVVTSFAVAQVNALQLDLRKAGVHPLENEENKLDTSHFVNWRMCDNSATSNNLGGLGPLDGPKEMRVPAVKTVPIAGHDYVLDLVVTVAEGSEYQANDPKGVNRVANCLGYTNVLTGSTAKLDYRFTLPGESAAWAPPEGYVPKFKFTIMDMDGSKSGVREQVTFDTPIDHLYLQEDHLFVPHGDNTEDSPLVVSSRDIIGNGSDNPRVNEDGILVLDKNQSFRTISVAYKGITAWSISFKADGTPKRRPNGRNFMWTGASDETDPVACSEWPTAQTFAWDLCKSDLPSNNLGGQGPEGANDENAEQEIRYSSVATVHGQALDLRVKAEDYSPYNVSRNTVITDRSHAGIHGCFGAINVKAASKVRLTFAFIDHKTGEVAKLAKDEGFGFSVFDIDQSNGDNEELVHFDTPYAREAFEGEHVEKVKGRERSFRSTSFGQGSDNIYDQKEVNTDDQLARTVKVMYNGEMTGGEAQWNVVFDVRGGHKGRNFLFGGCVHKKEDVLHPR